MAYNPYKVDGVELPTPAPNIKYGWADYQESADRNLNGALTKETIAYSMRKVELTWNYLTDSQVASIINMTEKEWFQFTYYEPRIGGMRTMAKCYRGANFDTTLYSLRHGSGEWIGFKMSFIDGGYGDV